MPHFRPFVLLLATMALPLEAGLVYRFTTKSDAPLAPASATGRGWIDGNRQRVERDPIPGEPRASDYSITVNGQTTYVNLQNQTYFDDKTRGSASSALFRMPLSEPTLKGRPRVTYRSAGAAAPVGEHATIKHILELKYRLRSAMEGVSVEGDVSATITILTAPGLPREPDRARNTARTGIEEIDAELTSRFASLEGMIVGSEITVTRTLEGGPAVTETVSETIDQIETAPIDGSLFKIPSGFRYQQPVYGVPGT